MLKTLAVVFICAVVASRAEFPSKLFIQNFLNGFEASYNVTASEIHTDETWENLIRHNIGLTKDSSSLNEVSKNVIDKYGKGSVFQPTMLTYIFLIESESLQNNNTQNGEPLDMDICSDSKSASECILSRIYNQESENSIVNDLKKTYGDNEHFSLSYLYTGSPKSLSSLKDYIYSPIKDDNSAPKLVESRTGRKFQLEDDLETCVNKVLRGKYSFDLYRRRISKIGTKETLNITDENLASVEDFMKDICSVVKMGKLMTKEKDPSLATFHITSLSLLEKLIPQDKASFIKGIWDIAYDKFVSNIMAKFTSNELSGQISYVKPTETLRTRLLQTEKSQSRILAGTELTFNPPQWTNDNFQKGVWFTVSFIFVLFFAIMTMVTMDFQKDTLLYAKFLTVDNR